MGTSVSAPCALWHPWSSPFVQGWGPRIPWDKVVSMVFNGLFHLSAHIKREMMVKTRFPLNAKTCQIIIYFIMVYTINFLHLMICRQIKKKKILNFINLWKIFKYQRKYPLLKKYSLYNESSESFVGIVPEGQKYIFNDTIRKWENIALKNSNSPFSSVPFLTYKSATCLLRKYLQALCNQTAEVLHTKLNK